MYIPTAQRKALSQRANQRCEYCLIHEAHVTKRHEPDHIIPRKHGGTDELDNLAWSCFQCNRYRGSDVAAFDHETGELTRIFNPRRDRWDDHFAVHSGEIIAHTAVGRITLLVLQINRPLRVQVRAKLIAAGLYP